MNDQTDSQLLCAYAENRSEAAFAELVRRHVDFVYSAARRMVCDPHLAEDVTQGVFVAFAKNARQLTERSVFSGWLHRTTQNIASQTVRATERRRAREQEAVAMNELLGHETDSTWENIAPYLDAALGELSEPDRDALLLRYFERKSAREMAQTLGTSEEAAQKRVNRAVERLREFFSKRNVTVGAGGLVILISTNAVQAAPVGLFAAISTAVSLVGTAVQTSTAIAATKTITMTTLQKTLITGALVVATGVGVYETQRASTLKKEIQSLRQEQMQLVDQIQKWQSERESSARQLAALREENQRLNGNSSELLKLRGEVGLLRKENGNIAVLKNENLNLQQEASRVSETNQLQFKGSFFRRDEWSNRGTDKPLNTVLTMFWAMKQGDETKLAQLVLPGDSTQTTDALTRLPKYNWDQITAVQIIVPSEDETFSVDGTEETAFIKAIVERRWRPDALEGETATDQTQRIWSLVKTNGQWLIIGAR